MLITIQHQSEQNLLFLKHLKDKYTIMRSRIIFQWSYIENFTMMKLNFMLNLI